MVKSPCGECQVCCISPAIVELDKPLRVPCKNLVEVGCGIYEKRPSVCRKYNCTWKLTPDSSLELRPDRLGLLVQRTLHESAKLFLAIEIEKDSSQSQLAQDFLARILQTGGIVYVVPHSLYLSDSTSKEEVMSSLESNVMARLTLVTREEITSAIHFLATSYFGLKDIEVAVK